MTKHIYTWAPETLNEELWQCTIEHRLTDDPDAESWYNSYDIFNADANNISYSNASLIVNTLVAAEKAMAFSNTQFVGGVVRPWQPITPIQEVSYMKSISLDAVFGDRDESPSTELPMDRVVRLQRRPSSGKRGHLDLRNCVNLDDISTADHLEQLELAGDLLAALTEGVAALNGFAIVFDGNISLAMIGRVQLGLVKEAAAEGVEQIFTHSMSGPISRSIEEWTIRGLASRQLHNN